MMHINSPFLRRVAAAAIVSTCMAASAFAQSVSFVEPADGATVSSPFKVKFAVTGMEVQPAGAMAPNTGHHHLLINAAPVKAGESVPTDATHLHFGKGQTETEVSLAPGAYTLTLQFANGAHQSYGPAMSKTIKVTVK
ncbi:hypothetical protein AAKU55_000064 [Oxalobacteraceae bacterium GrIS 1.11]